MTNFQFGQNVRSSMVLRTLFQGYQLHQTLKPSLIKQLCSFWRSGVGNVPHLKSAPVGSMFISMLQASDSWGSCHFWADISRRYNSATSPDPLTTNPRQSPSIHLPVTLNPIECACHEGKRKSLVCLSNTSQPICIAKLPGMWHLKRNTLLHKRLFTNK